MRRLLSLSVMTFGLLLTSASFSATYYVDSVNGDNSRQTIEAVYPNLAWKSISMAAANVSPGDVVKVKNGTYGFNEVGDSTYEDMYGTPHYDYDGIEIEDDNVTFEGYYGNFQAPTLLPKVHESISKFPTEFPTIDGGDRTQNSGFYASATSDVGNIETLTLRNPNSPWTPPDPNYPTDPENLDPGALRHPTGITFYYCCFDNADDSLFDEEIGMMQGNVEAVPGFDINDFVPVAGDWFQNVITGQTQSYRMRW